MLLLAEQLLLVRVGAAEAAGQQQQRLPRRGEPDARGAPPAGSGARGGVTGARERQQLRLGALPAMWKENFGFIMAGRRAGAFS